MKVFRIRLVSTNLKAALPVWVLALVLELLWSPEVRGNVYATSIRLNGGASSVISPTATNVSISYILNEPASAGVSVVISSGTNTIRTIAITSPNPGTVAGTNTITWDGKDDQGTDVGIGFYTVSITSSSIGYDEWTQISDDDLAKWYVWEPRGITVNKNPGSPYYGRIFVANSHSGPDDPNTPGDRVGLLKLNADGSAGEEGVFSDGGWAWAGDFESPWKVEVGLDDRVYVSDRTAGVVLGFDQALTTGSRRVVLATNSFPSGGGRLSGPCVTGSGTNQQLWATDTALAGGTGIRRWQVGANGLVATNDLGMTIVQAGAGAAPRLSAPSYSGGQFHFTIQGTANITYLIESSSNLQAWTVVATNVSTSANRTVSIAAAGNHNFYRATAGSGDMDLAPYDVAVDGSNRIYTIQQVLSTGNPSYRVFRFPAYDGNTESAAEWKIGQNDDTMEGAFGVAVDTVGRYLAVAFAGDGWPLGSITNGGARVFETTNGTPVVTLTPGSNHAHTDVAWDNVGNLYTADETDGLVRVYSPPGTNQTTTTAFGLVQIGIVLTAPVLSAPSYAAGQFQFTLAGQENVSYVIQASADLKNWSPVATNTAATASRSISIVAPAKYNFYRAAINQ